MPIGILDLSMITDRLVRDLQRECNTGTQLWVEGGTPGNPAERATITVTGLAPDVARDEEGCQLSVYLFHVAPDAYNRNMYLRGDGTRARPVPELPLPLVLHYLVTAHSAKSYVDEQQAMSVALKWFHEHPSITATVPLD